VLPLDAAAEAHRILENGHAGGKIVLDVTDSL
jgi:NADPH:quinone reductase-like Zn-dependent oxidoreductase